MSALDEIDTIVLVMMENRSFDHMLGHLSLPNHGARQDIDGLKEPLSQYANLYQGDTYLPHPMNDVRLATDLPHERAEIATQLGYSDVSGQFEMDGFARSYFEASPLNQVLTPDSMGFMLPDQVPMTGFLAEQFAVCDKWFSSLPAGTQPNRLMAWTGTTMIDTNGFWPSRDELLLSWMTRHQVRWRVYTSGISFFLLLKAKEALQGNFRPIERLAPDAYGEQQSDWPEVIIVEPVYGDAARITGQVANDDHAPEPILPGEVFLRNVYDALTSNPEGWARTLFVVTFDEHGGFYDHVAPPKIPYLPPAGATFTEPFTSLGPRVPTMIASQLVSAGHVCSEVMDHTSVLQLLAEKFTPGTPYSDAVELRRQQGVASVSAALNRTTPRIRIPKAPAFSGAQPVIFGANVAPTTPLEHTFEEMAHRMYDESPRELVQKYPAVAEWVLRQERRPY